MTDTTDRLDALESRIAEQDRIIEDLDATVTDLWALFETLQRDVARLIERLGDAESRLPGEPDRPPPHY